MNYMEIAIKESNKSKKSKDVPVGAIIVKNNKIIAKAHNIRLKRHLTINHAEINAIVKANKKIKDWRLNGCTMYVTLEPCKMCSEVIKESRLDKVYYLLDNNESNIKHMFDKYKDKKLEQIYSKKFKTFFKENCKR